MASWQRFKKLSHKQKTIFALIIILVVFGLSLIFSYFTPLRDPVTVAFKRLYPAAIVGNRIVSINDLEQAGIVGERLGVKSTVARNNLIKTEKSIVLADQLKINIPNDAAADEVRFYTNGNEAEYKRVLNNVFNNSEHFFYKYSVYPQVIDANLRMKYYSDIKDTSPAYKKAQDVLERINKGEKFEDLAKTESDDKITGQLGGDLGFYEPGQILPELEDQISISPLGELRKEIIITRLGYHIVYPVEHSTDNGKKLWHAKHILFVPEGYEAWLSKNLDKINIKYIKQ